MAEDNDLHMKAEAVKSKATGVPPLETDAASAIGTAARLADSEDGIGGRIGRYRWGICALLFFATTINYLDRQVFSILAPDLQKRFEWTNTDLARINAAFQFSYAIGLLLVGRFFDWVGTRRGFSISIVVWSLAAMGHAFARNTIGFGFARATLGLGEAGNFPGAVKTVAEWFPRKERALATGIFNAGSNVGATIAPIAVPLIALTFGWQWAFISTGAVGFVWLIFWLTTYHKPEEHPRLGKRELAHIKSDPPESEAKVSWLQVFPKRQTWAFALGKAMTDPIWWFYLTWLPKFLGDNYQLDLKTFGPPLVVIYLMADFGSVGGGWLSSHLLKRGWTVNAARKLAMFVCAAAVVPIAFATQADNVWVAVPLIGLAAAAHQGWSANLFTLVSDTFPRRAVGTVVGIGGMVGSLAASGFQLHIGKVLDLENNYFPLFVICASAYLSALLVIHILVPKLEPARLSE